MVSPMPEPTDPAPANPPPNRRVLIKWTVLGFTGVAVGVCSPWVVNVMSGKPRAWRVLSDAQAALLARVCDQIIPPDQDPGAAEAGCVQFIDRQLAAHHARHADAYRLGLAALEATCRKLHSKAFAELTFDQQTDLLKTLESNKAPKELWSGKDHPSASDFFRLVRDHTMQGFYGSPRHGGNRDYVSYRMMKLEYPRVIGRNKP